MIRVAYAVCSQARDKPLTRAVCDSRAEAEQVLARLKRDDLEPATYWIAELGPEGVVVREHYS